MRSLFCSSLLRLCFQHYDANPILTVYFRLPLSRSPHVWSTAKDTQPFDLALVHCSRSLNRGKHWRRARCRGAGAGTPQNCGDDHGCNSAKVLYANADDGSLASNVNHSEDGTPLTLRLLLGLHRDPRARMKTRRRFLARAPKGQTYRLRSAIEGPT